MHYALYQKYKYIINRIVVAVEVVAAVVVVAAAAAVVYFRPHPTQWIDRNYFSMYTSTQTT